MDNLDVLSSKLTKFLSLEGIKTREEIAAYVVGELIGDINEAYVGLENTNPDVARIADLSSDLEWSNGSPEELDAMWGELKSTILNLRNKPE